jgi:Zn-dependent peptidase ImmA (M78 family)/transcriptional regulator with XRE-family HTH domain
MEFIGENIRQLRELFCLSRKELAAKVGITEQTIWQYENGKAVPNVAIFNQLTKLFKVNSQYFFTENHVSQYITSAKHVAYRADDRDSRKKTKFELQYLNFVDYYIDYFESFLKVPQSNFTKLQRQVEEIISRPIKRQQMISAVAKTARSFLNIQDNRELMYDLERVGIYVLERKSLEHSIDAYSTLADNKRPFIVLGTERKSAVRRTFDLAHELGHLLLHRNIDMELLDKKDYQQIEREANDFAAQFLIPEKEFVTDFQAISRPSNPLSYLPLKEKYYVSITALELRAYHLGLLNYQQNRYFYARRSKLGYRLEEPFDNQWAPIKPGKIKAMLDTVFDNHLLALSDLSNQLHISKQFLIDLFALKDDYFLKYENKTKPFYSVKSNIINLF